jgi:ABC-type transport system involved in multi-copper enzyme maturation permease subunit
MSFLPIVQRELRAASWRKTTHRVRWWTATFAILIGLVYVSIAALSGTGTIGLVLFRILTGFSLLVCLLAGVLLTADCLSQEKRDGTLGLLFLTDLRGYDVVLGKFVANSISAFYALFALLPVTAASLLLGALTGAEFWRTALALINALFVSLAAGIFVSAIGRDSRNTMGVTLALLLLLGGGIPLAASLLSDAGVSSEWTWFAWLSPFTPFQLAAGSFFAKTQPGFLPALLVSNLLGWVFLATASWLLPWRWQQESTSSAVSSFWQRWVFGNKRPLKWTSRKAALWLSSNPIFWLLGHEPSMTRLAWAIVGIWALLLIALSSLSIMPMTQAWWLAKAPGFLLKILFATQAARFFSEARRTGMLEVLLSTPLRNRDLVRGQWMALRRIFFWPLCAFALVNFAPITIRAIQILLSDDPNFFDTFFRSAFGLAGIGWLDLGFIADIVAVGWFGMWLGLSVKKPNLAPAYNVLFVLILPSPFYFCAIDLVLDFILIIWSVTRLHEDFRFVMARRSGATAFALPAPPRLSPVPVPPPLSAQ